MNPTRPILFFLFGALFTFLPNSATSQVTGGQHVFTFLSFSPSARITGLGGLQIAVKDDDLNFALANPAALNPSMNGRIVFNHNFFLAGIRSGYVAYGQHLQKIGVTTHVGLRYLNYGDIKRSDETGLVNGKIKAGETAFTLGIGKKLTDRLSGGINFHVANSTIDEYKSTAVSADAGLLYVDSIRRFSAAVVMKNKGGQISSYDKTGEQLPFDFQFSLTKRLKYLPFRFGIVAHHLHHWDIRFDDPSAGDDEILLFGEEEKSNKGNPFLDNFFRHFVFNGEFLIGKSELFRLRFGYNHLRKRELTVNNYRSLAGFCGGVGIKTNRFKIDFGYATYHLAGAIAHFSLGTNLSAFKK